jgi:ketosteroid isomerase-like protein
MRRSRIRTSLGLAAAVSAMAASPAGAASGFNDPADLTAIATLEDYVADQLDVRNIAKYYAPDVTLVDVYAPGYVKGRAALLKDFAAQLAAVKSVSHKMLESNIASDGKFACDAMVIQFDFTTKDGKPGSMSIRQLDALKKTAGNWEIVQQHISMPADAKTGMALPNGPLPARGPLAWSDNPIPGPAETPAAAKVEIKKWLDTGVLSPNLDALMKYYGPGDDLIVYDAFAPGEMRGLKEVGDYYAAMMSSFSDIKVKIPELAIDSDGSFGIQIDRQDMQLKMKDGSTKYISIRQNDCMRRVDGKWYSFLEMISYPVDMKTGKSIMENPAAFK